MCERDSNSIESLNLSIRAYDGLKNSKIESIKELVSLSRAQLLHTQNFGQHSVQCVVDALAERGLNLAGEKHPNQLERDAIDSMESLSKEFGRMADRMINTGYEIKQISMVIQKQLRLVRQCKRLRNQIYVTRIKK